MDYLREIKAFYDRLETNPLATSGIVLWHALMAIANKARWPDTFAVAVSVLQGKTGLKRDAIFDARNLLQQQGLIHWRSRNGNQSAEYTLLSCVGLTDALADTVTHTNPTHYPTQCPTQNPPLTSYPTDTRKTKTKTKTKTNNEGPAPSADASMNHLPDGSVANRAPPGGPKKPGDAALIREAVEGFTADPNLRDALCGWVEMRQKSRWPLTPHAADLALKRLAKLSGETRTEMIDLVNEATMCSWRGFYPIPENGGKRNAEYSNPDERPFPKLGGIIRD